MRASRLNAKSVQERLKGSRLGFCVVPSGSAQVSATHRSATRHSTIRRMAIRGFTMIELLVVIGIIVLVMSFLGVAVMRSISGARVAATRGLLVKINGAFQQRVDAIASKPLDKTLVQSLTPMCLGNRLRAEALARKFRYRQAFPQTWADLETYNPTLLTMSSEVPPPVASRFPRTESAEVLYFLLARANVMGYAPEGSDFFTSSDIKDTDTPPNGKMEIVDAWGEPLRFYRWPTRLIRGGNYSFAGASFTPSTVARQHFPALPTTAAELRKDGDDPYGLLRGGPTATVRESFFPTDADANDFQNGTNLDMTNARNWAQLGAFHTVETYSVPLIVSGGPDSATGLYEPSDMTTGAMGTYGYLANPDPMLTPNTFDNITNHNVRSGGQ